MDQEDQQHESRRGELPFEPCMGQAFTYWRPPPEVSPDEGFRREAETSINSMLFFGCIRVINTVFVSSWWNFSHRCYCCCWVLWHVCFPRQPCLAGFTQLSWSACSRTELWLWVTQVCAGWMTFLWRSQHWMKRFQIELRRFAWKIAIRTDDWFELRFFVPLDTR